MSQTMKAHCRAEWGGDSTSDLEFDGKESITVSSPEEFGGPGGHVTPEDLQAGALNSCYLMSFLFFVDRQGLDVTSCQCETTAILEKGRGGWNFDSFLIDVTAVVGERQAEEPVLDALNKAKDVCFVSKALKPEIELEVGLEVEG